MRWTRVEDVARLVLRLLQHDLQINEVSVATEFQGNLPDVHLDGTQLQQVLLNLVKNAIDAMRSVAPETRRLRLTTSFDGHSTVWLSVQELRTRNSCSSDRERIFDPFFTTKSGGMGLGLAICFTVVENHGGKLRLVKSDSEGSIFELTTTSPGGAARLSRRMLARNNKSSPVTTSRSTSLSLPLNQHTAACGRDGAGARRRRRITISPYPAGEQLFQVPVLI